MIIIYYQIFNDVAYPIQIERTLYIIFLNVENIVIVYDYVKKLRKLHCTYEIYKLCDNININGYKHGNRLEYLSKIITMKIHLRVI